MNKDQLRKLYIQKRKALSDVEFKQLNKTVVDNFFKGIDLTSVKVLHTFLPITTKREVDTWLIIDRIRREFPHIRLSIPKVNNKTGELENIYFEGLHQLATNAWGIQEPKQGVPTEPEKIDLVLVPLLVFDVNGDRIGYGKGYYDRFLKTCRPDCKKIGLSLFPAIEKISSEEYDVRLDGVVTPVNSEVL